MVAAFEYFDEKNRERIQLIKERVATQKHGLSDIRDILELCKLKIIKEEEEQKQKDREKYEKIKNKTSKKAQIMRRIHGADKVDSEGNLIANTDSP